MLDILIKNAEIIDGTGKSGFKADVGIVDQRIVEIAVSISQEANQTIVAEGLHLAPGFIDPHMHSDLTVFGNRRAESSIHQGVTTEIIGNCGLSAAPMSGASVGDLQALSMGIEIDITWKSMAEYLEHLQKTGMAVNIVPLIGHSNVRGSVMGYDNVNLTTEQQVKMENLVDEAMEQGARGISTGLFYPPGFYSHTKEIIGLARIVAKHGGIYASHIRSESDGVLKAVEEAIEVGKQAEIQVQYSHVKISGFNNWEMIDDLIALLESDKAKDAQLGCDQYPYIASSTVLSSILPYWAQEGGGKIIAQRMKDHAIRELLRKEWYENRIEWDNRSGVRDWNDLLVTDCLSRPEFIGMTIEEIASQDNLDPLDAAMSLMSLGDAQIVVVYFDQHEDILKKLMKLPFVAIGSDSMGASPHGILGKSSPHPRCYGTFPRVLGRYAREEKVLTLEEAIKKMTSLSAERFSLTDRGVIREGAWADIVLFDAQVVSDKATYTDPHHYPEGIQYVIVNGEIVINRGEHTGALPGQVL
jgi:N-acyl-D-amino-acid deacylase